MLRDNTIINIQDFGSGSRISKRKQRVVKNMAKTGLSTPRFSQLLFRLADHFKPHTVLELGTSLGINTLYLASASAASKIYTFEGCPETAAYAEKVFNKLKRDNIELIKGNLDITLPQTVNKLDKLDIVYFDANHRYNPTISYFETCLTKAHDSSIFIFDDIHWSDEMEKAWKTVQNHPKVALSIDIFDAGIVFFERSLNSGNYILEF